MLIEIDTIFKKQVETDVDYNKLGIDHEPEFEKKEFTISVNCANIERIRPTSDNKGCVVRMTSGTKYKVRSPYKQFKEKVNSLLQL